MRRLLLGFVGVSMVFVGSCANEWLLTLGKPGAAWWMGRVPCL